MDNIVVTEDSSNDSLKESLKKKNNKTSLILGGAIGFFVPILVLLIGFKSLGVYPFGTRTYFSIDGMHQYLPFLTELQNRLHNETLSFYSWNAGLGYDFFSVCCYYLACPLNLLVAFVPTDYVNEFATALVVLKSALAGLFMVLGLFFIYRKHTLNGYILGMFGVMYGLSNYVIGYHINIMWMDAVMLLPFLVVCLNRLVEQSKCAWYSIVLSMIIISNFYIGIAVCLFCVIYYVTKAVEQKQLVHTWYRFAGYSLIAGGIAGVIIAPSYHQILSTQAIQTLAANGVTAMYNVWDIVSQMLTGTTAHITSGNVSDANIYCGIGALFFLSIFLLNNQIALRRRICASICLLILFLSFVIGIVNLAFHGMHEAYGFPNRHAFIYIFLLLQMGFEGVLHCREMSGNRWSFAGGVGTLLVGVCMTGAVVRDVFTLKLFGLSVGFYIVILIASCLWRKKEQFASVLCVIIIAELVTTSLLSMKQNGTMDRSVYMARKNYLAETLSEASLDWYRVGIDSTISNNETMLYGQRGMSIFTSSVASQLVSTMHELGFYTSLNQIQYTGHTDFTDMLLGVKYTEHLSRLANKNGYSPITDKDIIEKKTNTLPLAFATDSDILKVSLSSSNAFKNQNKIAKAMNGRSLYRTERLKLDKHLTAKFTPLKNYHYFVYVVDAAAEDGLKGDTDGDIASVTIDKSEYYSNLNRIYDLGVMHDKKKKMVSVQLKDGIVAKDAQVKVYIGYYKDNALIYQYNKLIKNPVTLTDIRNDYVSGSIKSEYPQTVVFTIPKSKGWSMYVDSEPVAYDSVFNTFISVTVPSGAHEITLRYESVGARLGVAISCMSLGLLLLLILRGWERDRLQRKNEA